MRELTQWTKEKNILDHHKKKSFESLKDDSLEQ